MSDNKVINQNDNEKVGVKWLQALLNLREEKGLSDNLSLQEKGIIGYKSIIYSCVTLIAETIAQNEWKLEKNDKIVNPKRDYVYKLLNKPNPLMDWYDFVYLLVVMNEVFGERYIYVVRDKLGRPVQLYVIPSWAIEPVFDDSNVNLLGFRYTVDVTGNEIDFKPNEIVYDFIPGANKINRGESPLSKVDIEFDIHQLSKKYVKQFYKNSAVPHGILTTEQKLNEKQIEALEKQWSSKFQGTSKSHMLAVLYGGLDFKQISIDPSSKDFIEQNTWSRNDLAACFKIPPGLLGYTENVNKNVAEEQQKYFARYCIKPRLTKLQLLFNNKLFPIIKAENYNLEFTNPVPIDEDIRVNKCKVAATFGLITINEARKLLGFEELEDSELGNRLIEPLNLPEGRKPAEDRPATELEDNSKELQKMFDELAQIERAINE
jgi:HK97 family phage portal protein